MRKGILAAALSLLGGGSMALGQEITTSVVPMQTAPTCSAPRIWGSAEYLLWWVKEQNLSSPLLTTTSNPNVVDAAGFNVAGGIGRAGTSVLVGDGGQGL